MIASLMTMLGIVFYYFFFATEEGRGWGGGRAPFFVLRAKVGRPPQTPATGRKTWTWHAFYVPDGRVCTCARKCTFHTKTHTQNVACGSRRRWQCGRWIATHGNRCYEAAADWRRTGAILAPYWRQTGASMAPYCSGRIAMVAVRRDPPATLPSSPCSTCHMCV